MPDDDHVWRHPPTPCPTCGYEMDTAQPRRASSKSAIAPGDLSVCLACGAMLAYTALGGYRLLGAHEYTLLPRHIRESLADIVHAIEDLRRHTPDWPRGPGGRR